MYKVLMFCMQALDVVRKLQESAVIPIARAQMRIRLTMSSKDGKRLKEKVLPSIGTVEDEDWSDEWELIGLIDPGQFKVLNDLLSEESKNSKGAGGRIETLSFAVAKQNEAVVE